MARFHSRSFPPPGVNRDPLPPKSKLPVNLRDSLFDLFLEELRHPKSPMGMLLITLPGFDPFPVRLERVGKTSLIIRRLIGMNIAAVSLALSGGVDDEAALNLVATELIGDQEEVRPRVEASSQQFAKSLDPCRQLCISTNRPTTIKPRG